MRRALPASGLALCLAVFATPAFGFRAHDAFAGRPELERHLSASGLAPADGSVRGAPVWDRAPRAMRAAWSAFVADVGPGWRASFDGRTGVPQRLFGPGLAAPGSLASPAVAEAYARSMLERHIALLAPGTSLTDFELVSNDLDANMRTLGFAQRAGGMRVKGGQVSFRFKNDRLFLIGSEAIPRVAASFPAKIVDASVAEARALAWVDADFFSGPSPLLAGEPSVQSIGAPLVLPLAAAGRRGVDTFVVLPVTVAGPSLKFTVYVDAASGRPIAREQMLRFANATVSGHVPVRSPSYGPRFEAPLPLTKVNVEGSLQKTTITGVLTWTGPSPTPIELFLDGDRARVQNAAGPEATLSVSLTDLQSYLWDQSADEAIDAQISTFVHAAGVREYAKTFAPQLPFNSSVIQAQVNIDDVCNAFSDGTTINFYAAGSGCENTGRIADVVYHEYGHSLHAHAIIEGVGAFEGALSEGASDYLSATITGDPAMGRGFFLSDEELRHIDPPNDEAFWPNDLIGEVHYDGLIIGQALWDMRKELVAKMGETEGVAHANVLYYQALRRAVDIPSMHPEVLAADDDDGDITNGTPNVCEINTAFRRHGLVAVNAGSTSLGVSPPKQEGFQVSVELIGLFPECETDQLDQAVLTWRNRDQPAQQGTIVMAESGASLSATIPNQTPGTVVEYGVNVAFEAGSALNLPDNAADPWYEFFVGEVIPLYCTDFETDPEAQGWTHDLAAGEPNEGADDWGWGEANGSSLNGDPTEAWSGEKVYGNDLVPEPQYNGNYQANIENWAKTPVVDTMGHKNVRLQMRRWLNVEDGFFDQATIKSNETPVWANLDSDMGDQGSDVHHTDKEWRFQDVDLSDTIAADGTVQVGFWLKSDQGLQMGGWTLDDVCIVAYEASGPVDPCVDGGCGGGSTGEGAGGPGLDFVDPNGPTEPSGAGHAGWGLATAGLAALALLRRRRRS